MCGDRFRNGLGDRKKELLERLAVLGMLDRRKDSASCTARLRPVCPPSVASRPLGRSFSMIRSSTSTVSGSRYVMSATPGSVMIVAGFEFTRTVSMPSSRSARQAWVPA